MEILVHFLGILRNRLGVETLLIELPEGAVFGDLMDDMARRFKDRSLENIWDQQNRQIKPGVLCIGEGRDFESVDIPLKHRENVRIMALMAGG